MSMFRNIGSALTMGGLETTRSKEARESYIERCGRHEESYKSYKEFVDDSARRLEELWREAQRGRELVIETGALYADGEGNLQAGWYPLQESPRSSAGVAGEPNANSGDAGGIAAAMEKRDCRITGHGFNSRGHRQPVGHGSGLVCRDRLQCTYNSPVPERRFLQNQAEGTGTTRFHIAGH